MADTVTLSLHEGHQLAVEAFLANGCDPRNAEAVARSMMKAEGDRCSSHGLFRLPGYLAALKSGKVNGKADPKIIDLTPGAVKVDGDNGMAPLALEVGRDPLIEKARAQGIAALALTKVHHFSALWVEVEALCDANIAGFAFTAYKPVVTPGGGTQALYGTNPMAFGWPRPGQDPVIFDQASSAKARGEIQIAARDGHAVPPGTGIGPDGQETTDPNEILKGAQLPFGGYKGANIAMMVELLVAGLIGEWFSFETAEGDVEDGGPPRGGEFMMAIDPNRFGDAEGWAQHSEAFFERFLGIPGTRLPSSRRYQARSETPTTGITIPVALHEKIKDLMG
jgi:delta1-piperideine-2-carboxylate reductase